MGNVTIPWTTLDHHMDNTGVIPGCPPGGAARVAARGHTYRARTAGSRSLSTAGCATVSSPVGRDATRTRNATTTSSQHDPPGISLGSTRTDLRSADPVPDLETPAVLKDRTTRPGERPRHCSVCALRPPPSGAPVPFQDFTRTPTPGHPHPRAPPPPGTTTPGLPTMTRPTFIFVVLLSVQTVQAFPITGNHRTHRKQLVVRVERLFQLQDRVYRRRSEKHVREEEGSRRHHVQKREGSDPSHFSECPAHYEGYCLNGGRCRYAAEMGTASCLIEEDVFGDLRRLFGSWSHSEPFYRRTKWRRP
ncbi:EGF [Branchiostoma lanceolatum]|uniref:EGF protein n=1 Tax=Branchiostoma lanceolatum TaxID=7740 RepID=A0A8J9Z511_BRALA|nr:EGF [Branchiostoma lanceolatum]